MSEKWKDDLAAIGATIDTLRNQLAAAQERILSLETADEKATRLYRALHGLDADSHDERAESVMTQWFDGTTVTSGNRASLKAALATHFEAVAQSAEARAEALIQREKTFRALIADDAYAMSFQTLGQFRTSILGWIDERNDIDAAIAEGK